MYLKGMHKSLDSKEFESECPEELQKLYSVIPLPQISKCSCNFQENLWRSAKLCIYNLQIGLGLLSHLAADSAHVM